METAVLQDETGFEFVLFKDVSKRLSLGRWHGLTHEMTPGIEFDCGGEYFLALG